MNGHAVSANNGENIDEIILLRLIVQTALKCISLNLLRRLARARRSQRKQSESADRESDAGKSTHGNALTKCISTAKCEPK